jgi:hypothetical protein
MCIQMVLLFRLYQYKCYEIMNLLKRQFIFLCTMFYFGVPYLHLTFVD